MKTSRLRIAVAASILALSLACTKGAVNVDPSQDPGRAVAIQTATAAKALNEAVDLKRKLYREGLITAEQSQTITKSLLVAVKATREIQETVATYRALDGNLKSVLLISLNQAIGEVEGLAAQVLPGLDQKARDKLRAILSVISTALTILEPILREGR